MNNKKFAVIGVSGRGSGMALELQNVEGVEVAAICDLYADRVEDTQKRFQEEHGFTPDGYTDYKELLKREDICAVMVSTTWITHSRIAVDCMCRKRRRVLAACTHKRKDRQVLYAS